MNKIDFAEVPSPSVVKQHADIIAKLEETFDAGHQELKLALFWPYFVQMTIALHRGERTSVVKFIGKALACFGIDLESLLRCGQTGNTMFLGKDAIYSSIIATMIEKTIDINHATGGDPNIWLEVRRTVATMALLQRVAHGSSLDMIKQKFPNVPPALFDEFGGFGEARHRPFVIHVLAQE
ncbi:hypothetical protein BV898_13192 [Hypsibius exemplaris]|uniref:Uncharacterized protein n=1 Tax=Hypsibius exemplaris TaxID=2072580 RepID=A0A1W0WBJ5_HYPEX|nr:hypothetical protein BV898_13192 [Hypsibius exemplaris]